MESAGSMEIQACEAEISVQIRLALNLGPPAVRIVIVPRSNGRRAVGQFSNVS